MIARICQNLSFIVMLLLLEVVLCSFATAKTVTESELKAAYIFRFAQYTRWPEPLNDEFRLCLLGAGEVMDAIEKYSGRVIQGVSLVTIRSKMRSSIDRQCHAAFLTTNNRRLLRQWIRSRGINPILLISDVPAAFDDYADIVLSTEPNRVTFSINHSQAKVRLLSFSSQMLKLARKVR